METRCVRSNRPSLLTTLFVSVAVLVAPLLAEAHITRIEITRVESPTFEGASFGEVGPYEKLAGRAYRRSRSARPPQRRDCRYQPGAAQR